MTKAELDRESTDYCIEQESSNHLLFSSIFVMSVIFTAILRLDKPEGHPYPSTRNYFHIAELTKRLSGPYADYPANRPTNTVCRIEPNEKSCHTEKFSSHF